MLSQEENDLLTRTGSSTPMGTLMRRYWIPALLSKELRGPDCPPLRVRLLGEDLVAFRDSRGRVGLLSEYCSHRRASLFYGRNEECGLRCVYHGWKYDTEGNISEIPSEPPDSNLKNKIHHKAYPCREVSGVIFAYMGPKEQMPLFPNYEWLVLPSDQVGVTKFHLACNYLQALEGDCDSAHAPFLHRGNGGSGMAPDRKLVASYEVRETRFGLKSAAIRETDEGLRHFRVYSFVAPFIGCVPTSLMTNGKRDGFLVVYQVPCDDYHTWRFNFRFRRSAPVTDKDFEHDRRQIGADFRLIANRPNDYLIDREKQRTGNYTGIEGFTTQDACVTESMGPICDRTEEHVGLSDSYIIAVRRFMLRELSKFQNGVEPAGLVRDQGDNEFADANSYDVTVSPDFVWK
jgi:phthalate 4,5-dioxygenase oxygenase subunit